MEQEFGDFLAKGDKLPDDEFKDEFNRIRAISEGQNDFTYTKDKLINFVRFQKMKQALLESGEKRLEKGDFQGIAKAVNEAASIDEEAGGAKCLAEIQAEKVKWLWGNRIPLGKLSLLVGDPGVGKSFFTIFLASRITTGKPWPNSVDASIESGKVLMLTAEDGLADTVRPRADEAGSDVEKIFVIEGNGDKSGGLRLFLGIR